MEDNFHTSGCVPSVIDGLVFDFVHHPSLPGRAASNSQYSQQVIEVVNDASDGDHAILRRHSNVIAEDVWILLQGRLYFGSYRLIRSLGRDHDLVL
jgi:hypothetical protein